jgi:high-affinity Fe2+/Pb2+ permease
MIEAVDVGQVKVLAVVILVALALLGIVVGILVQKVMLKVGLLAVVVVLFGLVWWQRSAVARCARTGSCTFFGVSVNAVADHVPR